MKGASDGGLYIPHKEKRFPGFHITKAELVTNKRGKTVETEKAKASFNPKEHASHIFGGHVQKYYDDLKANNAQRFNKQFSNWEKALKGEKFETVYKKVHGLSCTRSRTVLQLGEGTQGRKVRDRVQESPCRYPRCPRPQGRQGDQARPQRRRAHRLQHHDRLEEEDLDPSRPSHPRPAWRACPGQDAQDPAGACRMSIIICVCVEGMDSLLNLK